LATAVNVTDARPFSRLGNARLLRSPHVDALVFGAGELEVTLHHCPGKRALDVICCGCGTSVRCLYAGTYALRSHITFGTIRCGGYAHGLLFKIGLRSPRRRTFGVTAARLAGDVHRIRGAAVWFVAADV
jgi:hypothetical protein